MPTEREKMAAGEWYSCMDAELDVLRSRARRAVHQHNTMPPDERGAMAPLLGALFAASGEGHLLKRRFIVLTASTSTLVKTSISIPAARSWIPQRCR